MATAAAPADAGDDPAARAMAAAVNAEFRKWVDAQADLASDAGPYAAAADALADLATSMAAAGADVTAVVAAGREALATRRSAARAARSLGRAASAYAPPAARPFEGTDFGALLASAAPGGDDGDDEAALGATVAARLAAAAGEAPGDGGEDVVVEDGDQLARNQRCPLSGKLILDLRDPVVDIRGFVYERDAIAAHIDARGRPPRRHAPKEVPCPVAGTRHSVSEDTLKPAIKVLQARAAARREGRSGRGRGAADVVA